MGLITQIVVLYQEFSILFWFFTLYVMLISVFLYGVLGKKH